ncbi:MAG TPA: EAL domain-containing protein [Candidatus Limnocylindria bacterium]|nr:EAL domain-containing protein [Candidatus Limnocylindria bacterium]
MSSGGQRFELQRAIAGHELVLHYQPRLLVRSLELRGVEALVRWRHPVRGIVSAAELVAAAEHGGLMHDLEAWVIREALLQAAVWRRDGMPAGVSVNITPALLRDEAFLKLFDRTLHIQGDPTTFTFEVSAASLAGQEPPLAGLTHLRERGVRLALDDVTSPGELEAATWFRWDYVKLGQALVGAASREASTSATLHGLAARTGALGARVIAVGVEDAAGLALLRDAGAYLAQGYLFAPPLGLKELADWSAARARTAQHDT